MKTFLLPPIFALFCLLPFASKAQIVGLAERDTIYLISSTVDTSEVRGPGKKPAPEAYNGRDSVRVEVFDQGHVPGCVGYTVAAAIAQRLNLLCRRKCHCRQSVSPFSASYIYNQVSGGQLIGISLGEALDTLQKQGICPEKTFPNNQYSANPQPPDSARKAAFNYCFWKPERIFYLPKELPNDHWRDSLALDLLRNHVANDLPVMVGLRCPDDFRRFRGIVYRPADALPAGANHAALVVGYDNATRTVEILNSFGTGWGDGGFCRIGYADFCRMARYGFVVRLDGGRHRPRGR